MRFWILYFWQKEIVIRIINEKLSEIEKSIITMRFGLNVGEPLTQRDIAQKLGISRSYISRMERRALIKLRKEMNYEF